jgi:hypothetical protein
MSLWSQQKTTDRLEDRLRSVEIKCDDLERAKKGLDLEFTELYDKVSHQMSRMAKRYARAEKAGEIEPEIPEVNDAFPGVDPISKSIMMRRARQVRPE